MVRVVDVLYKDTMEICLDYASDYAFVEGEARELINESLLFKVDTELLLGTNTSTSMNSIDQVASEFSAANVVCVLTASIEKANYSDLILGMATQIDELGKNNAYKANVAIVNNCDFFKFVQSAKDTQGRYLDPRVTSVGGNVFVGDLLIVSSTDVPQNELYVIDSSKGVILDRRSNSLSMSTENGENFVDGFATLLATTRLQFLVKGTDFNAFMQCSDVATAITAITV
jgi:HK97 family phage major capsid protein